MAAEKPKKAATSTSTSTSKARDDDPVAELEALLAKVKTAEQGGDPAAALKALESAPQGMRIFASFHFARGALLFRRGDLDAALAAFREAVKLEPEIPEFAANLGAALVERFRRQKDAAALDEAIAALEAAAARGPRSSLVHGNLGMAYQAAGRLDDALSAFDAALERDPKDVSSLYNRAATLHLLGREEECLAALDATLAAKPDFEPARQSRARTLARLGRG